jgi:hypothetical protein
LQELNLCISPNDEASIYIETKGCLYFAQASWPNIQKLLLGKHEATQTGAILAIKAAGGLPPLKWGL